MAGLLRPINTEVAFLAVTPPGIDDVPFKFSVQKIRQSHPIKRFIRNISNKFQNCLQLRKIICYFTVYKIHEQK